MGCERGQATVDYVAIIAVVAIVFGAAFASVAAGAPGIVNAVAGQVRHALCLVGGGRCPEWRSKPCTVATRRDMRHMAVTLLVVRYDDDRYVLREAMSDGTVRLTVGRTRGRGVELGIGAHVDATIGGRKVGASADIRGGGQATFGSGDVYVARDDREADRFMKIIRDGGTPAPSREDLHETGVRGHASGGLSALRFDGSLGTVLGYRRDLRSGAKTWTLNPSRSGWAAITAGMGPAVADDFVATLGLTLDRRGRATELSVQLRGTAAAGAALPLYVSGRLGSSRGDGGGFSGRLIGRRWELGARLDLRDPVVAATWRRFRRNPASGAAIRALGTAIRERSYLDVRTYGTDGAAAGVDAGVGAGLRLAGEYEHTVDRSRLLAASSRPPAGLWEPRIDCV